MVRDLPILGYRQTTDAYLLGLAVRNGGRLITFDKKIGELAEGREDVSKHLVCVEAVF
jgi:predicted nucleic acid-binding protein